MSRTVLSPPRPATTGAVPTRISADLHAAVQAWLRRLGPAQDRPRRTSHRSSEPGSTTTRPLAR